MDKINKDVLTRALAKRCNFNIGDIQDVLDGLIGILEEAVADEQEFNVRGFGKIVYGKLPARETTDPRSHERVQLPATNRVGFKFASNIRKPKRN